MLTDLRYAIRSLVRTPGYALIAVLTLALGIGANTTVFSWMEGLVLNPFPTVREPSRLVSVRTLTSHSSDNTLSYPVFAALRERVRTVDGLSAYEIHQFGVQELSAANAAEPIFGAFATTDYFSTLGVRAQLGRLFAPSDSSADATPVVVISDALWRRHFRGDSTVIGRSVRVNGHVATIVGVAAPNFAGSFAALGFELWVPLTSYDQLGDSRGKLESPYSSWLTVFGRLRPGATLEQARAELDVVGRQVAHDALVLGISGAAVEAFDGGGARRVLAPTFTALLGVTALVMLIVCANLANLFLARASGRRRELGVRAALGAGRGRLARQLLVECLTLAIPGALLGVALAAWGRDSLAAFVPSTGTPVALDTPLDLRVLSFACALTFGSVLLFGLAPAWRASRLDLTSTLKHGTPGSGASRSRLRGAFVVSQIALSLVTVVSAALFVRTLRALDHVDPGLRDAEHVLLVGTDFGFAGIRDTAIMRSTVDRLLARVATIPGVTSAAVADYVPMGINRGNNRSISVPGYTPRKNERMAPGITFITPDYFDVMRIPVRRGRPLRASDPVSGPSTSIVVNESFVNRYLAGRDPIGAAVALGIATQPNAVIVGVAHNVVDALDDVSVMAGQADPAFYAAYASEPRAAVTLHIRTSGEPMAVLPDVRRAFRETSPDLALVAPVTLAQHATGAFSLQRLAAWVLGVLGGVALLLAALGLYGVTSYAVTQRTHEVGVRVALGASARQVLTVFVSEGFRLAAIGVVVGSLMVLAVGRLLASQLYGVKPNDPLTLAGTALLLTIVALAASYIPARRATHVNPIVALRAD